MLGDHAIQKKSFPGVEKVLKELQQEPFKRLPLKERLDRICRELLQWIEAGPEGEFLLIPALDFVEQVYEKKIVDHFHFNMFELWLNQFSGLSSDENLKIRGKLSGRFVPRQAYQSLFPIGMGKVYPGSHFVTAHSSPDLDTTVASFWGWVDAFAARVASGVHVWNVPGGRPPEQVEVELLFSAVLGPHVFDVLAKHRSSLSVSSIDLMTQEGVVHKRLSESVIGADAVVVVGDKGGYLGEWRSTDIDKVRSVVNLLNQCLRWYENALHVKLVALFGEERLTKKALLKFFDTMFEMTIEKSEPAMELMPTQQEALQRYLTGVLGVSKGVRSSFRLLGEALKRRGLPEFATFMKVCLKVEPLFEKAGKVTADRTHLFRYLAHVVESLEKAIYTIRLHVDELKVALAVKTEVFGMAPEHVNYRADLDEIRAKIGHQPYLTVTAFDRKGRLFPLGVIHAIDLFKQTLGTVSLRDFSNREETKVPPYLDIISVIDHHKSQMVTSVPSAICLSDAQSSNVLVAQLSFALSDPYSLGGMSEKAIEAQIAAVQKNLKSGTQVRILQRLLQRQLAARQRLPYFVAPEREMIEYQHFLYAILDDTDLLTKVSAVDVRCVAELLNRLKSLVLKKEVEIIHFDDIPHDAQFAKKAAARILQNDDMYSLYKKVYLAKEAAVQLNLQRAAERKSTTLFADTKEQNGCCRVGQTKLFAKNFPTFIKHANAIRCRWFAAAQRVHKEHPEIDFYLHMVSTIPGAEAVYAGKAEKVRHQDELWLWIAETDEAVQHLKSFLSAFRASPGVQGNPMAVEFLGKNSAQLKQIFHESFGEIPMKTVSVDLPIAVLKYRAGSLNSRKSAVAPYLPTIL